MTMPKRAIGLACAALATAGLAACGGGSKPSSPPTTQPPAPSTSTPAPSTSSAAPAAVNPFTGEGPAPKSPTVIVKIDDTAPGRPQVGIDKADIVYVEAVEGGEEGILRCLQGYAELIHDALGIGVEVLADPLHAGAEGQEAKGADNVFGHDPSRG